MKTKTYVLIGTLALLAATGLQAIDGPPWSMASRLYGDRKARRVGDLLTVLIVEESQASRDAQQDTGKSFTFGGSASFTHPNLDNRNPPWTNAPLPAWSVEASRDYEGKGSLENKDTLSGAIACRVMEVLQNGNLLIEGKRSVYVRSETVTFILTGSVRVEDIKLDNTVESTDVADATIRYETTGTIADSQKKGMVPRMLDWINPF